MKEKQKFKLGQKVTLKGIKWQIFVVEEARLFADKIVYKVVPSKGLHEAKGTVFQEDLEAHSSLPRVRCIFSTFAEAEALIKNGGVRRVSRSARIEWAEGSLGRRDTIFLLRDTNCIIARFDKDGETSYSLDWRNAPLLRALGIIRES
jgi:hypothetical protein